MATWEGSDDSIVRLQEFNTLVHNVQLRTSIMKKVVSTSTTGAAKVSYFRETAVTRTRHAAWTMGTISYF